MSDEVVSGGGDDRDSDVVGTYYAPRRSDGWPWANLEKLCSECVSVQVCEQVRVGGASLP